MCAILLVGGVSAAVIYNSKELLKRLAGGEETKPLAISRDKTKATCALRGNSPDGLKKSASAFHKPGG